MVKVVAPVSGTVEAAPERELCEKLPSGELSVQFVAFCVFQNIEVRAPSGTAEGTAQISTCAGTAGVEVAVVVVVTGLGAGLAGCVVCCTSVTCGCGGCPTW